MRRSALASALVFSGMTSLIYEIIWARLLGLVFGTTTEAIASVLAIFFLGLSLGNWLTARWLERVERPLRVYALLELAIGLFALLSLPLLQGMDGIYAWAGAYHGELAMALIRLTAASAVLLPPTMAMGATLPVVARGLVDRDQTRGRWSAILYGANTVGAVAGGLPVRLLADPDPRPHRLDRCRRRGQPGGRRSGVGDRRQSPNRR